MKRRLDSAGGPLQYARRISNLLFLAQGWSSSVGHGESYSNIVSVT